MDGIGKLEPSESDDQTVLPRHVKRALDYLNSNLAEKITPARNSRPPAQRPNVPCSNNSRDL